MCLSVQVLAKQTVRSQPSPTHSTDDVSAPTSTTATAALAAQAEAGVAVDNTKHQSASTHNKFALLAHAAVDPAFQNLLTAFATCDLTISSAGDWTTKLVNDINARAVLSINSFGSTRPMLRDIQPNAAQFSDCKELQGAVLWAQRLQTNLVRAANESVNSILNVQSLDAMIAARCGLGNHPNGPAYFYYYLVTRHLDSQFPVCRQLRALLNENHSTALNLAEGNLGSHIAPTDDDERERILFQPNRGHKRSYKRTTTTDSSASDLAGRSAPVIPSTDHTLNHEPTGVAGAESDSCRPTKKLSAGNPAIVSPRSGHDVTEFAAMHVPSTVVTASGQQVTQAESRRNMETSNTGKILQREETSAASDVGHTFQTPFVGTSAQIPPGKHEPRVANMDLDELEREHSRLNLIRAVLDMDSTFQILNAENRQILVQTAVSMVL
jgi:hypothetical protein